jgi:hypothetical protein
MWVFHRFCNLNQHWGELVLWHTTLRRLVQSVKIEVSVQIDILVVPSF